MENKEDIQNIQEFLIDVMTPKFSYEQLKEMLTHETLVDIANESFWKLLTWAKHVHMECELNCVTVYWCKHSDWYNAKKEDYECITYDYDPELLDNIIPDTV